MGGRAAGVVSKNCRIPQQREGSESMVYRVRHLSIDLLSLGETLCREGGPAAQPPGSQITYVQLNNIIPNSVFPHPPKKDEGVRFIYLPSQAVLLFFVVSSPHHSRYPLLLRFRPYSIVLYYLPSWRSD